MAGTEQVSEHPESRSEAELARELERLRTQNEYLREEIRSHHNREEMIGASAAFAKVRDELRRVATTDAIVLILGEAGTGKELAARAIHSTSRRASGPFIKLDCTALPADRLDGELFGEDASPARAGLMELARGGTLFIDEIGALESGTQARLLHLLQQSALAQSGENSAGHDVRVLAATNRNLRKAVRDGEFREDLYYRLNVFPVELPPLRARVEDIPLLVQFFARKYAPRIGRRFDGIDPDTLIALSRYPWPGNIRELENLVERALILNTAPVLKIPPEMLAVDTRAQHAEVAAAATGIHRTPTFAAGLDETENTGLHHVQREHILRVLNATHWVIEGNSGAALKLGMKPATLRHRMKKLGIARGGQQPVA
jgi:formate hydrogenlyase transcriptional activator